MFISNSQSVHHMIKKNLTSDSQREEGYIFHNEARELDLQLAKMEHKVSIATYFKMDAKVSRILVSTCAK